MNLVELYNYINTDLADPRTNDWFLVHSVVPIFLITSAYLYFVLKCGPRYMKNRPPYKLKGFIKCYNIFQIVTNTWVVYTMVEAGWYREYFLLCVPDKERFAKTPQDYAVINIMWYVLCTKLIDYIETAVFVLRKKQNQVSILHLYHHVSTVLIAWLTLKYFTSKMAITVPGVNCMIHVIMYTYYLLSSFGPSIQYRMRPIKRLITIAQMVQFVILITYSMQAFTSACSDKRAIATIIIINLTINFTLFYNFYKKTYTQKINKS